MHHQIAWEERIYNRSFPLWFRIFATANARCTPNLHAEFETGELAKLLGKPNPDGTIKPLDRRHLHACVQKTIQMELLDATSSPRCLVLPSHAVGCRLPGADRQCRYHTGAASTPRKAHIIRPRRVAPDLESKRGRASMQVKAPSVMSSRRPRRAYIVTRSVTAAVRGEHLSRPRAKTGQSHFASGGPKYRRGEKARVATVSR
jgi:hypothetical protein